MKRIAIFLAVIILIIIAYVQIDRYIRNHPPSNYDLPISEGIDETFHDPNVILEYLSASEEAGDFGREIWKKHLIDVKEPKEGKSRHQYFAKKYELMCKKAKIIEEKLTRSKELKTQKFSNADIKVMMELGIDETTYSVRKLLDGKEALVENMTGPQVYELQALLKDKGYDIPVDGYFADETKGAVIGFQQKENLYPTGVADALVLSRLLIHE